MLTIMRKVIDLKHSPVLYDEPFSEENLEKNWNHYSGEWWFKDGWVHGKNPDNKPGMIVSKKDYPGNVILEFEGQTVLPSTHDIDFMWNGSWDEKKNKRGTAYVGGIQGWWEGKIGIEKAPDYKLTVCNPLFIFKPGKVYNIKGGSIDGHCFVFVDGKLLIEMTDPEPIDSKKNAKIGFEAYASHIKIRNLVVSQISWKTLDLKYEREF